MTLTEFLLLRVAEDEAAVGYLMPGTTPTTSGPYTVDHPVRLLAECAAKRAIVEWHTETEDCCEERYGAMVFDAEPELSAGVDSLGNLTMRQSIGYEPLIGCVTLMMLAAVYRDHPDYDATWRP